MILECRNLSKTIGKKEILKNVSLEVDEGDILGFIGPNGAGKTTTIKLIIGLQKITSGNIKINGYSIESNFEKAIERVGTIVENPDLYMYMSGYDNLKLIANMYKNVNKERINEVVKLVGLEKRINDKVAKYSLGMRQRLGIAQAILHKPNLLILDEPTNGLDPEGIKKLRDLLKLLANREKMGVLISSHNLAELESFCNKVAIIQNGEVIENSSIEEAKRDGKDSIYVFEVDSVKRIKVLLTNKMEEIDSTNVKIYANKNEIPEIVAQLVKSNVRIYKIYEDTMNLESVYLKKTGGNID